MSDRQLANSDPLLFCNFSTCRASRRASRAYARGIRLLWPTMSGEGNSSEALKFPAPRIPIAHPLTAYAVRCSSPPGLTGHQWRALDPAALEPVRNVLTALRRDVRTLYSAGRSWADDVVRARLDLAISELSEVVSEQRYDLASLGRYLAAHSGPAPVRTREADDRYLNRLIRAEQNRIDHRRPKGKTR